MSDLVVIAYPDEHRAAEVMLAINRMSSENLVDLEDACYVTKGPEGKVRLHQSKDLTAAGALSGGLWGMLIGLFFLAPVFGLAVGAATGALTGKASDYGIDDAFMKRLAEQMKPGSSAIFTLTRKVTADKVIPELAKYGGTVLRTSLSKDAEEKLEAALQQGQKAA
ncbi:DUF1269 domain-containing protein [Polyangium jinanense]|uniref:DUF1269 domain-containing protein n=1 Tax=Polyangium jinanense TaxID=2829994 RepID=A0A9X3XD07_9BACT|nr:DUF1269 domain-containing protein [Polyangium jinanense]MDC3957041.1 DUF1269 domain-containing protein [Polyangium jinanense]MDC3987085.1 DUF1269 domain-containing protein [Polyangium jinanense]